MTSPSPLPPWGILQGSRCRCAFVGTWHGLRWNMMATDRPWQIAPVLVPLLWTVLCLALVFQSQMVLQLVASCSWSLPA